MIYTSEIINPTNSEEKDIFDTNKLDIITFNSTILESSNNNYEVTYLVKFKEDLDVNNNKIIFEGSFKYRDSSIIYSTELDPQELTNQAAEAIYERTEIDNKEIIIMAKENIIYQIRDLLLLEGVILKDTRYNSFGYIYSDGDKIATFETVKVSSRTIELGHVFTMFDLNNIDNIYISFLIANKKYTCTVTYNNNNIFNFNELDIIDIDESIDVKDFKVISMEDFIDEEKLIENRKTLLSSIVTIDNTNIDDYDDLF